jgi:hypothetical protein
VKELAFIVTPSGSLSITWNPLGFHVMVNMNLTVRISRLGSDATSSRVSVHIRGGEYEGKN